MRYQSDTNIFSRYPANQNGTEILPNEIPPDGDTKNANEESAVEGYQVAEPFMRLLVRQDCNLSPLHHFQPTIVPPE